jgi:prepilin-type N-terminal cleavage/methylation domain-containing protein
MKIALFQKATERGFTLVELMVVAAIISVLSAVLFASFDEGRKQSRDKIRRAELKELQLAIELYKAQNGLYPERGCGVTNNNIWTGPGPQTPTLAVECPEYIVGLAPSYVASLPLDPNQEQDSNKGYLYLTNSARTSYKLMAYKSVENETVSSTAHEFARCPSSCGSCGSGTLDSDVYAVYSVGAECW